MISPPLSLYIHIPWCQHKCPYCDFYSIATSNFPEQKYIQTLMQDLNNDLDTLLSNDVRPLHSIFIGGGTPSLLSARSMDCLFNHIHNRLKLESNLEITMEANPGTITQPQLKMLHEMGINRLSFGVQSFQDAYLQRLQRIHNADEAKIAIMQAMETGFQHINIDLMHGLPEQTVNDALFDLKTAVHFQPTHLSWYQLTIEPNTPFGQHPPKIPKEALLIDMSLHGQQLLEANGYQRYEISAYCRQHDVCEHNVNYWQFGDYLGIGAGAHGKITDSQKHVIRRTQKNNLNAYLNDQYINESQIISNEALPLEFMMNALRLTDGIPTALFQERTGINLQQIEHQLDTAYRNGFIEPFAKKLQTTPLGRDFLDTCLEIFIA